MSAAGVVALFFREVFRVHGLPKSLICDRETVFTSHFWRRSIELLGIKANRSSAFHPQTDGQTERMNFVLEQYFRIYCDYQQTDWASLINMAEFQLLQFATFCHNLDPVLRQLLGSL